MALTLSAKAPGDIIRYAWAPALADGDSIASYTLTELNCTIDSDEIVGDEVVFFVSAGTAGTVATITAEAVTNDGEELNETLYLPIIATTLRLGNTANDVCAFALRKIAGNSEDADAAELEDALERLNDMLAAWKVQGADVGTILPVVSSTALQVDDAFLRAIKYNLKIVVHEHYGEPVTQLDAMLARQGLGLIKNVRLSDERQSADYY